MRGSRKAAAWAVMAVVFLACGPSLAEINAAKVASYDCEPLEVLAVSTRVVSERLAPIERIDPVALIAVTRAQWFSKDTGKARFLVDPGDKALVDRVNALRPGDVLMAVVIRIMPRPTGVFVRLENLVKQVHATNLVVWRHDPAEWPFWIRRRTDRLRLQIHQALASCDQPRRPSH